MSDVYWPDSNEAESAKFYSYRARAELIVGICNEIRTEIDRLAPTRRDGSAPVGNAVGNDRVRHHVEEFVQQLARMEDLARQLMDHAVEAEALGVGHTE